MANKKLKTMNFGGEDTYYLAPNWNNIDNKPSDLNYLSYLTYLDGLNTNIQDKLTSIENQANEASEFGMMASQGLLTVGSGALDINVLTVTTKLQNGECIDIGDGMYLVKVSDATPSLEQILQGFGYITLLEGSIVYPTLVPVGIASECVAELIPNLTMVFNAVIGLPSFMIACEDNMVMEEDGEILSIPEKGIYAIVMSEGGFPFLIPASFKIANYSFGSGGTWESLPDKPFGETFINLGDTLTWDGNTDGYFCAESVEDGLSFYHISDKIPTVAELKAGGSISATVGEMESSMSFSENDIRESDNNKSLIIVKTAILIAYEDNLINGDLQLGKKGIYFIKDDDMYISKFQINGYNFGSDPTIKTLDLKYLPPSPQFGEFELPSSNTFNWAGDTEGRYSVEFMGAYELYHVSDEIPTYEQLSAGGNILIKSPKEIQTMSITEGTIQRNDDGVTIVNEMVYIANKDNVTMGDCLFEKKGIYFLYLGPDWRIIGLELNGYTFESGGNETKKLNMRYLPDALQFGDFARYGNTFTWDGNTDGLETFVYDDDTLYRVCEYSPKKSDFTVGYSVNAKGASGEENRTYSYDDIIDLGETIPEANLKAGMLLFLADGFVVCVTEDIVLGTNRIHQGVYFIKDSNAYISRLIVSDYMGINGTTTKPLDEKFMPLLTSPNGTQFKLSVADNGTLTATPV